MKINVFVGNCGKFLFPALTERKATYAIHICIPKKSRVRAKQKHVLGQMRIKRNCSRENRPAFEG